MIVQCEHCQTKYRIADEKVKGKGVKVRCAKCENVFTVTPSEVEKPAPPTPEPTPLQQPEPAPPEPEPPTPEPGEVPASEGREGLEPPVAGLPSEDMPVPDPVGEPAGLPPLPSLDDHQLPSAPDVMPPPGDHDPPDRAPEGLESPSLDGIPLDLGAQRPAHEMDQSGLASPQPGSDDLAEEGGFEIEATLREDAPSETGPFGDTQAEGLPPLGAEKVADGEWGDIKIGGQGSPESESDDFGLAGESGYTPPPPMPMEELEDPASPDHWEDDAHGTSPVPAYQPETRSSGGAKKGIIALLLLAALGGGGYYAYPTVMEMIQSKTGQTEGTLTPANIQVKPLNRADGKIIYSVRGEVRNESEGNVGMIQVEAQFRSASGDVLSKASSYCGNLIPDSDLVRLDLKQVQSDLQNELGQSLSNASIVPGQAVPFLVVLDNPPSGISKVTVTISSFKETT